MARNIIPPHEPGRKRATLSAEQLKVVEKAGGRKFTIKQERAVKDLCVEYSIQQPFDHDSVPARPVTVILEKLCQHTAALERAISEIDALNEAQRFELRDRLNEELGVYYPDMSDPFEIVCAEVVAYLASASTRALANHKLDFGGRGRPPRTDAFREFIWRLADVFSEAGGKPGVWRHDATGKLASPFLRFILSLNLFLPKAVRVKEESLPNLVKDVCDVRAERLKRRRQPRDHPQI